MWIIFEIVAVVLWLSKDNIFYLLNFSYIGTSIALGLVLMANNQPYARRIVQLLVGTYMLVYLGLIDNENMQIEGFWYYLFTGVFEEQQFEIFWNFRRNSMLASARWFLWWSITDPIRILWISTIRGWLLRKAQNLSSNGANSVITKKSWHTLKLNYQVQL